MRHLEYLLEHRILKPSDFVLTEENEDEGKGIAHVIGATLVGWWKDMGKFMFTDTETGSSFTAKNMEEAKKKVRKLRTAFWAKVDISKVTPEMELAYAKATA